MQELQVVKKLRPYITNPEPLSIKQRNELSALRLELAEMTVDAYQKVAEKRRQMLWPKDKEMTELDRKTRLDGDVAVYERDYQFLLRIENIVADRLKELNPSGK